MAPTAGRTDSGRRAEARLPHGVLRRLASPCVELSRSGAATCNLRRDELPEATRGPDAAGAAFDGEELLDWIRERHVEDGEREHGSGVISGEVGVKDLPLPVGPTGTPAPKGSTQHSRKPWVDDKPERSEPPNLEEWHGTDRETDQDAADGGGH